MQTFNVGLYLSTGVYS